MKGSSYPQTCLEILQDEEAVARRGLDVFVKTAQKAIKNQDIFTVAISGGHTPKRFFELIGDEAQSLEWNKIHLFWVDERYVPMDSEKSNYNLAAHTFINKVSIPENNIHRIPTEPADFNYAARLYERAIQKVFELKPGQIPEFDLVVLGMGVDGHTGSLFPNSYAPFDKDDLACVVYTMGETLNRITLTHPVLKAAKHLIVLIIGRNKAKTLQEILTGEPDEVRYPIHALWPVLNKINWLVDKAAAELLKQTT